MNKNSIKQSAFNCLKKYGFSPNPFVLSNLVETSIKKKNSILNVLRKHPNWHEDEMCIILEDESKRNFNQLAILDFINFIYSSTYYKALDTDSRQRIRNAFDLILSKFNTQFVTSDMSEVIKDLNNINPNYHIHTTGKTSKVIRKICKEEGLLAAPNFEQAFSAMSDQINPSEKAVKSILSIHFTDFLEMSNGEDYSWSSCHNLIDGCHMSGTISYALDESSMIYYQVPAETPIDKIHDVSRIVRQVYFYNDEAVAQSRLYPQDNDARSAEGIYTDIRNKVLDIFSICLGVKDEESPWLTSKKYMERCMDYSWDNSAYPDWEIGNPTSRLCTISKLRTRTKMLPRFQGGAEQKCIVCGNVNYSYENLICDCCS